MQQCADQLPRRELTQDPDVVSFNRRQSRGAVLSPEMRQICQTASLLTDVPVLLHGESGTGKGVVAKEIAYMHRLRNGQIPFVTVNCAILNNDIADSMLFGHRRGAFTGAYEKSCGAIGEADGGILFLDEIHCLSITSQRKLLRLLDEGTYTVMGEATERRTRFHLITATNQDLGQLVSRGEFLFDLLMRIQGIEISLPPLRARLEELPDLIKLYFTTHDLQIEPNDTLSLVRHCAELFWPGNVRQLFKALDVVRFKALIQKDTRYAPHFVATASMRAFTHSNCTAARPHAALAPALVSSTPADVDEGLVGKALAEISNVLHRPIDSAQLLESLEVALIRYALHRFKSIKDAMSHLNLSRGQLDFKRRKYSLMDCPCELDAPEPECSK